MNESYDTQTVNPSIEKYVSASNNGIETHKFTRCVIGYILNGEKYVYYDDKYEGENETYIEASVENSSSILYDKEIRNKPRTRRTKRNV